METDQPDNDPDTWLRREVSAVYDAMKADPSRAISLEDAFDAVRKRHAERIKSPR